MASEGDTISSASESLSSEMRRGLVSLAVLAACRTPQYGYSLKQTLSESRIDVNEGTLYPLLRRLEEQDLLSSEWQIEEGQRPRRYYTLAPVGAEVLRRLQGEWRVLAGALDNLLISPGPD